MSSFTIKIIAVIAMLIDHSCDVLVGHYSIGYIVGRIAFPLFAFQMVIGYKNTHDIKKYLKRLLIFAFISQIPYGILFYNYVHKIDINIFFTLFLSLICLIIWNEDKVKLQNKYITWIVKILIITLIATLCEILNFDHGYGGILTVLFINLFYPYNLKKDQFNKSNKQWIKTLIFVLAMTGLSMIRFAKYTLILGINDFLLLVFSTFISTMIMLCYNGKKGPSFQYLFYIFYPLHLTILNIIYYIIHK